METLQREDVPFILVAEKTGSTPRLLGLIDAENIAEYLLIKKGPGSLRLVHSALSGLAEWGFLLYL